ncbi:MAG: hypothetical protein WCA35_07040, partial [Kovacikia sp.]
MSDVAPFDDIEDDIERLNDRSLNTLARAIQLSQGQFSLILVRCNYISLRDRIVEQLQQRSSVPIQVITLPETTKTLFTTIQKELECSRKKARQGAGGTGEPGKPEIEIETEIETEGSGRPFSLPPPSIPNPHSILILGLESLTNLDQVLTSANQVREE